MKRNAQNAPPGQNVPRDTDSADAEASDRRHFPGPDDRNAKDEDQAAEQASRTPDSPLTGKLHEKSSPGPGQLDVGTGGDAGRPGKEGVTGKPIPRRGDD